jgi:hypothetical protein
MHLNKTKCALTLSTTSSTVVAILLDASESVTPSPSVHRSISMSAVCVRPRSIERCKRDVPVSCSVMKDTGEEVEQVEMVIRGDCERWFRL